MQRRVGLYAVLVSAVTSLISGNVEAGLLVSNLWENEVLILNEETESFGLFASGGGLLEAAGLAYGPDGNLYVASRGNGQVLRYNGITGSFIDAFVTSGSGGLTNPTFITFGPDGNLYVSNETDTGSVLRYDGNSGAFIDSFATGSSLSYASGLAFDAVGDLYVGVPYLENVVKKFDGTTGAFEEVFADGGGLTNTQGLTFGPDGNLYVSFANPPTDAVLRFDGTTGDFIDTFVPSGGAGDLEAPIGLRFSPDGNLYIASVNNGKLLKYNGSTGEFFAEFTLPITGEIDGKGNPVMPVPFDLVFQPMSPAVPEPSAIALLVTGCIGLIGYRWRRRM